MPQYGRLSTQSRVVFAGLVIVSLAAACAFWWLCVHSDSIAFLPAVRGADWIVYPKPPDGKKQSTLPVSAVFQHSLTVSAPPAKADVTLRAFRSAAIAINGRAVPLTSSVRKGWKSPVTVDVTDWLQAGTNVVTAWVTNTVGPPALWLRLQAGQTSVATDSSWQVSLAGADWRLARRARSPLRIPPGNPLYGAERTLDSVRRVWPVLAVFLALSLSVVLLVERCSRRKQPEPAGKTLTSTGKKSAAQAPPAAGSPGIPPSVHCNRWGYCLLAVVLIARAALFLHNLPLLPRMMGFDAMGHEDYVRMILEKHTLPLPGDGWETHQPPLYYAGAALLLGATGLPVGDDAAAAVLRGVNGAVGLVHCCLLFFCLRLLFPANLAAQSVGLLTAAFLPVHLYLSQYTTNDPLAGLFVTGAFYLYLRALRIEKESVWLYLGLGAALGAAVLTKLTAALAVPLFPLASGLRLLRRKDYEPRDWMRTVGAVVLSCLLICGWHYARVWARLGAAPLPNWETDPASAWWEDPGVRTSEYYLGFGRVLVAPLFSALHSFADGIYSTLWGDGLASGAVRLAARPPWNYDLMNAGYLLSLGLSLLFIVGLVLALTRFISRPGPQWLIILGPLGLFGLGILYMSLRGPWLAMMKAFYAFPALLPFSAVIAVGWDWLARKHRCLRAALWVLLLVWTFTVCGAFWIRPSDPQVPLGRGLYLADQQRNDEAAASLSLALEMDQAARRLGGTPLLVSNRAEAHFNLAMVLDRQGQTAEAVRHYREALEWQHDLDGALNNLAWILATSPAADIRNGPEAVRLAERACALTRNQTTVCIGTLAAAYAEAGRFADAVATAEKAIACANLRNEVTLAARNQQLLEVYRAGKPFHEASAHSQ